MKQVKSIINAGRAPSARKHRKVAIKLSLHPDLISEVRARLRDSLSFSAHVSRVLREDLERWAAGGGGRRGHG
jgi:hypothetical protein